MKIVSVFSNRGGVGKTTIASALALSLFRQGYTVGLIDLDMMSPGLALLFDRADVETGIAEALLGEVPIYKVVIEVLRGEAGNKLYLIPTALNLKKVISALRHGYSPKRLKEVFDKLRDILGTDMLIVDTRSGLSSDTLTMLALSDLIIIVIRYDCQDFVNCRLLMELFKRLSLPVMLAVNIAPPDKSDEDVLRDVEERVGVKPTVAIPFCSAMLGSPDRPIALLLDRCSELGRRVELLAEKVKEVLLDGQAKRV